MLYAVFSRFHTARVHGRYEVLSRLDTAVEYWTIRSIFLYTASSGACILSILDVVIL